MIFLCRKKKCLINKQNLNNQVKDLKSNNLDLIKQIEESKNILARNKTEIENLEEQSFEFEVEIRKINNFINQTS